MKLKNNWQRLTLESLENEHWPTPNNDSDLVKRCHELRKTPLDSFTTEDLRLMIGQRIGLQYLIPLALDVLTEDLFAEGNYFKGDLLKNVLTISPDFWNTNKEYWTRLNNLIKDRRNEILAQKFDTTNFDNTIHR